MGHIKRRMREGDLKVICFHEDVEGTLWFKERLVVSKREALKKKILGEAHTSRYSIHPGSTKMYHDLRQHFCWMRMKHEAAHYVSKCDACRKVKANSMKPAGLFQPLSIPEWKWDDISKDFIVGLPMTDHKFDSIWVIMDRLSKSAHFIPINTDYIVQKYAEIYIAHIFTGSSEDIILRPRFTFCHSLLGATARVPWNPSDPQFSLSPTDRLSN
jgi:hypothetical protein